MNPESDYLSLNRELWNQRTDAHLHSAFYGVEEFLAGKSSLRDIELSLLEDLHGKSLLHLQCHFGQDTISLARLGAEVTGADLSDRAIEEANLLAQKAGQKATFIRSDVYALPQVLDQQFDRVFTTYGTIGWLPDMTRWAKVVAHFLKPGGKFLLVEFHPAVWMFDNEFTHVQYSYFNREAIIENNEGTYADRNAPVKATEVSWNHDLGEVLTALLDAGLRIEVFKEYDYSPWECFSNLVKAGDNKFYFKGMEGKLPVVYAVRCVKPE